MTREEYEAVLNDDVDDDGDDIRIRILKASWIPDDNAMRALLIALLMQSVDDLGHATGWWPVRDDQRISQRVSSAIGFILSAVKLLDDEEVWRASKARMAEAERELLKAT